MAGGAVGNTVSYVGTNLMMNGNFGSFEGGLVAFGTGALSGAAGGSVAYGLGDGLIGTTAGGYVGSATGSYLNGDGLSAAAVNGLKGAGIAGSFYLGSSALQAYVDYQDNQNLRGRLSEETGFSLEGIDDLYNKQISVDETWDRYEKVEFGLLDDSQNAVQLEYNQVTDVNHYPSGAVVKTRMMHSHGPFQDLLTPSPGDYQAARKIAEMGYSIKTYQMSIPSNSMTANKWIYEYNSSKIINTYKYEPNLGYTTSFKQRFRW